MSTSDMVIEHAVRGVPGLDHDRPGGRVRDTGRPTDGRGGSRGSRSRRSRWSQVATAHLSHGLVMCSLLVVAYLGRTPSLTSAHTASGAGRRPDAGSPVPGELPLASLAVLMPRIDASAASSLHAGYDASDDGAFGPPAAQDSARSGQRGVGGVAARVGRRTGRLRGGGDAARRAAGGASRARRALVWAFGGALVLTWVPMLDAVVTAGWFRALLLIPFGDVYLHNPGRMRYLAVIAIPILGAVGIQGLRDEPMPAPRAALWLGGGAVLWLGCRWRSVPQPDAVHRCSRRELAACGVAVWLWPRARTLGEGRRGRRPRGRTRRQRRVTRAYQPARSSSVWRAASIPT